MNRLNSPDSSAAKSEEITEVFHWTLNNQSGGSIESESLARARYVQMMLGDRQAVANTLRDASTWKGHGLTLSKVAEVPGIDLDRAFMLTNHIDSDWTQGGDVVCSAKESRARSSSVGDLFRCGDRVHLVANLGFVQMATSCSADVDAAAALGLSGIAAFKP